MSVSVTPLNMEQIRELCEKDGSLYVINYTDRGQKRNRGNLHISFVDETGSSHGIVFPNTWIPIDASTYASTKQLVRSQTFISSIRNGDLIAINRSEALKILDSANAKEEAKKVATKYANVSGIVSNTSETVNIFSGDSGAAPAANLDQLDNASEASLSDTDLHRLIDGFNSNALSDVDSASRINSLLPRPSEDAIIKAMNNVGVTSSETYKALLALLNENDGINGAPI